MENSKLSLKPKLQDIVKYNPDDVTATELLREVRTCIANRRYPGELVERIDAFFSQPEPQAIEPRKGSSMSAEEVRGACERYRDTILHNRGALAENEMTNDQVNDVLAEFDAIIGPHLGGEMSKLPVKLQVYQVLERAVEEGVAYGYMRGYKYSDTPSDETVKEAIVDGVMLELSEVIKFED